MHPKVPAGLVRLVAEASAELRYLPETKGLSEARGLPELVTFVAVDEESIRPFVAEVERLVSYWPPFPAAATRRTLQNTLRGATGDPLPLVEKLVSDVRLLPGGELVRVPVDLGKAVSMVLPGIGLPRDLKDVEKRLAEVFADTLRVPTANALVAAVCNIEGVRVEQGRVVSTRLTSYKPVTVVGDPLADELQEATRTHDEVAVDRLKSASSRETFRLVVTPPEKHPDIGRSLARALSGNTTFVSFEEELLKRAEPRFEWYEKGELFAATRVRIERLAEETMDAILDEHGRPGASIVLGDTALFERCKAEGLVRRLYDTVLAGQRGFWVLVIPGVIKDRQPRLNERFEVFHPKGAVLPIGDEIPGFQARG